MPVCMLSVASVEALTDGRSLAALAGAYLLGSVPFGLVLARLKGVDLRAVGSGNIGATNTMRAIGRGWGIFAFVLDFFKGFAPILWFAAAAGLEGSEKALLQVLCGAAAVVGHCFPVYLGFHGGKGVATGCGAIVALDPVVFLWGGAAWLVTLGLTRFVGLASLVMGATFPVAAWFLTPVERRAVFAGALALTLLILVRHRANIARMLAGEEPRIGEKLPASETETGSSPAPPHTHD